MHLVNNQDRAWASPAAAGPVSARVRLPASKSITNRALVLAVLGDGPAVVGNPLRARDTTLAADALRALGSEITESRTGWLIAPGQPTPGSAVSVDVGNAGTVMRFVPGVAALTSAVVAFDGDARARQRPVGPILAALRERPRTALSIAPLVFDEELTAANAAWRLSETLCYLTHLERQGAVRRQPDGETERLRNLGIAESLAKQCNDPTIAGVELDLVA